MYEYAMLKGDTVLMIRHKGCFEGADTDNAYLEIAASIGAEKMRGVTTVIHNYYDVDSMTLKDTDYAAKAIFFAKMAKALNLTVPLIDYLTQIEIFEIEPSRADIALIYRDRMRRLNSSQHAYMHTVILQDDLKTTLTQAGVTDNDIADICWRSADDAETQAE